MPEIWLRYGTTDVVLDIKFENLSSHLSSNFQLLPEEQVASAIAGVPLTDNMLVLPLSSSKAASKVVVMIAGEARAKGLGITVDVPQRIASALRTNVTSLAGGEALPINRIDYQSLQERINKFQSTVLVSTVSYDPLFGYAGAPSALVRHFLPEGMGAAFGARRGNLPAPGVETDPLKVAISSTESIPATSIEMVANSAGIVGVHTGAIADAFAKATAHLTSISVVETDPVKCAILSASSETWNQSTLAGALNSLWNNVHIVKEGGSAILLAECREGSGGGALQMFVEGRLKPEQLEQLQYVDGLEHLMYMNEVRQRYELGLVSTLPHYYSNKMLGFTTYAGMKDLVEKLPARHGKNYRALVLSDADITLLRQKAQ
jgi:hypothetical protein